LEKGDGMSFSEFCYPVMQAWDWWNLYKTGTQVQIGGADQFGNILAGAEAVKYMAKTDHEWLNEPRATPTNAVLDANRSDPEWLKRHGAERDQEMEKENRTVSSDPMGFTVPLLTTAAGEKFGKSAGNAIWLDRGMTNSFDLYQVYSLLLITNAG
jgi:tyrosyl-tRNA synthetase